MKTNPIELAGIITLSLIITYLSLEAFFTPELTERSKCECLNTPYGTPCCVQGCIEDCESPFNVCNCK